MVEGGHREEGKDSPVSGDKFSGRDAYYSIEEPRFIDRDFRLCIVTMRLGREDCNSAKASMRPGL